MKTRLPSLLACPLCANDLRIVAGTEHDGEIESGALGCESGHEWPIRDGVPRLVPLNLPLEQARTAQAFGWEWRHFDEMHPEYEPQFLDWLHPIEPESFYGKLVLDGGCGTGRHARLAARYGARDVVALDLSDAVDTAQRVLAGIDNAHVVQGDLLRPPFRRPEVGGGFDLAYSIGVLHHLPDPRAGFLSLRRFVRPGGTIAVWVYGYENNGFVRHVVEPLRRATTRISPSALRAVAFPLAVAFHGVARGIYRPLDGKRAGSVLPLHEYLADVGRFSFRQNYSIVFDQLVAPTAAYIKEAELRAWFDDAGLADVQLSHRHGNSWRGRGLAPAAAS